MTLDRLRTVLVLAWMGVVLCLAFMAAPTAFALLPRTEAGQVAGALFRQEALLSLALAVVLFVVERRRASQRAEARQGSQLSVEILLALGALFCTVLGYFALQPLMEAARQGQGRYSFGALHGASSGLFALKGVLLAVWGWRATGARP